MHINWKRFLQPKVLIPIALAGALLAFILSLADLPEVIGRVMGISFTAAAAGFGCACAYLLFKGVQFHNALKSIGIRMEWKKLILAYAIGEMTIPIPAGVYLQNYVLQRIQGADIAFSSAATSAMLVCEVYIVLGTLVGLPLPGWEWVSLASAAILASATALEVAAAKSEMVRKPIKGLLNRAAFGRGLIEMVSGMYEMVRPKVLIPLFLMAAIYLATLVEGFFIVAHGVGAPRVTYLQALEIYFLSLGVTFILAGMTQLGVIEAAGLGAARAFGYSYSQGLAMMIGFRIVWLGSIWLVCGVTALILRKEFQHPAEGEVSD